MAIPTRRGSTIERVTYPARNMGMTIVANLFKPAGFESNRKYTAVVVTHPFGGVKEQTSGLYAQRLAEQAQFVTPAVAKLTAFFGRYLGPPGESKRG